MPRSSICDQCKQPFSYVNKGKPRRFCGPLCYAASMIGIDKGGLVTATCSNCGQPFTVKRFYFNRSDGKTHQRFCSRACATPTINAAHQKHQQRACLMCGTVFMPKSAKAEFCSHRCAGNSGRNSQALIAMQQAGKPTSIERRMKIALDAHGIAHEQQYVIYSRTTGLKRYVCDFAIPEAMLIIECDGNYWHARPKAIASDKRKNKYLHDRGYALLRFTETEINQDVDRCVQVILSYL